MTLSASSVVNQKKIFPGTWCFNKRVEISYSVERMVLHRESKLEKNETNDADTFITYDTVLQCAYIFVSTAFYTFKYKLMLWLEHSTLPPFDSLHD